MPAVYLRAATAEDQPKIRRMIRDAGLNPFGLHWPRFVLAVDAAAGVSQGLVVGIGQVKILGDRTPELASLAVLPEYQRCGIGGAIIWTLIDRTAGPLYLRCASHNEAYYLRYGFRTLALQEMPRSLRRTYRAATVAVGLYNRVTGNSERLLIMRRPKRFPVSPCTDCLDPEKPMPVLPPAHERLYTRIYAIVRQIPHGQVATYGQVAELVGDCTARVVGYAMAAAPDDVPWQRVINAQGKISPRAGGWGSEAQRQRLEEEGVHLDADHKVDFKRYRWGGPELDWLLANDFAPAEPGDHPGESASGDDDTVQPSLF